MKILKFSASWCKPCEAYAPVFNEVVKTLWITSESIDVEKSPDLAGKYMVMSIPFTVIVNDEWKTVFSFTWPLNKNDLTDMIKKYFKI